MREPLRRSLIVGITLALLGTAAMGWWDLKTTKRVATAMWSSGDLAIRERRNFQRTYDLAENVIPDH
ncbi:MAG: crosslink repair DNA glycosylase YcaQ family protein, partial [Acidobacteriota bacterium]